MEEFTPKLVASSRIESEPGSSLAVLQMLQSSKSLSHLQDASLQLALLLSFTNPRMPSGTSCFLGASRSCRRVGVVNRRRCPCLF